MGAVACEASKPPSPQPPRAPDPVLGQRAFERNCTSCHGADGRGMNGIAANFAVESDRLRQPTETLVKHIREGYRGEVGIMPPWGSVVDEQGAKDIIAYLRQAHGVSVD